MTEIIFVKTRHHYDSYTDFFKLVELSDFPTIFVDEVDISKDGFYIVSPMNGEWRDHINNQAHKPRYAHLVLWNLERPSGSAGIVGQYIKSSWNLLNGIYDSGQRANTRFLDEIWVSDSQLADETGMRFVPLGSDEGLGEPGDDKKYSFCHISYEVPRRVNIYKYFPPAEVAPNCWPPERDNVLKQSKFALNVHQDIYNYQEPLRLALFAAYGLPVISEDIFNIWPWTGETIVTTGYYNLVARLKEALTSDYEPYREMGLRARERMTTEFRFKTIVERAVMETTERWR